MYILGFVGVGVVVPVMRRPPHRATLHGCGADDAENELPDSRGLERAMREIPVVKPGDGKHADEVGQHGHQHGDRAPADPNHGKTRQMHADEGQDPRPLDLVRDLR